MSHINQYIAVILCGLCVMSSGSMFIWLEPLMSQTESLFSLSADETSWVVAFIEVGELAFSIPAGVLADRYGRKLVILSGGPIGLSGWILLMMTRSIPVLYLVRFLQGVVLAIVFTVIPLYIAEVADQKVRGQLAGQFQTMWSAGLLFTYLVGPYTSFQVFLLASSSLPCIFTLLFSFMPESPYYLLLKGQEKSAEKSLKWLRDKTDVSSELSEMKNTLKKEEGNKAAWRHLFKTAKDRKIFLTVQLLVFVKYMIGSPAMSSYAAHTFSASSGGVLGEHEATILYGTVLLFSAVLGAFLSDKFGRRLLLIGTLVGIGLSYSGTAVYFYLNDETLIPMEGWTWVLYVSIALAGILSNIGPSSLLQTVQGELFPSETRALGGALAVLTSGVASFIDLKQFQSLIDWIGIYSNFVVFAFFSFFGAFMINLIFKETAGLSLGQIQTDLKVAQGEQTV